MSMITAAYHIDEARRSIAIAADHLAKAKQHDVDPEVAGPLYGNAQTGLRVIDQLCAGLKSSRQPDLDRERAAIDEGRAV